MNVKKLALIAIIPTMLISTNVFKSYALNNSINQEKNYEVKSTKEKSNIFSADTEKYYENKKIYSNKDYSLVESIEENLNSEDINNIDDGFCHNDSSHRLKKDCTKISCGNIDKHSFYAKKGQVVEFNYTILKKQGDMDVAIYDSKDNIICVLNANTKGIKKIKFNKDDFCYTKVKEKEIDSSWYIDIKCSIEMDSSPIDHKENKMISQDSFSILETTEEDLDLDYIKSVETKRGYNSDDTKNRIKMGFNNITGKQQRIIPVMKNQIIQFDYITVLKEGKDLHIDVYDKKNNLIFTIPSNKKGSKKIKSNQNDELYIYTVEENANCYLDLKWSIVEVAKNEIDKEALEIMQKTGNWSYVEPLFPSMTSEGVEEVVALYIKKTGNHKKAEAALPYINKEDSNTKVSPQLKSQSDYDALASETLEKTNDIYRIMVYMPHMSTDKVDTMVKEYIDKTDDFNCIYAIRQYISTEAIDNIVKSYVDRKGDYGTVAAMLQFMSPDASKYVAEKYINESKDQQYRQFFAPYL